MDRMKFRRAFRVEVALLIAVALLFILPMKVGSQWAGGADRMIWLYYALSLLVIAGAQLAYMWPLRTFLVEERVKFGIGMVVFMAVLAVWLSRFEGRTIDFSNLSSGALLGPLLMAVALPAIHGFVTFLWTSHRMHREE